MPYWRLASFYFFYFAALGALIPFWGLYLKDRGFTPLAIGELMAILTATKIVAPNLWGSIGFIIAVPALGAAVERIGTQVIPELVLVLYAGIWLSSLVIPDPGRPPVEQPSSSLSGLLRKPEIAAFLTACFLMQVSHGTFYVFYSLYLTEAGYSSTAVGALWAWGVILEVLVFWRMHRLLERFGARRILLVSLGLAVLRWLLTGGFAASPALQLFAQTLHAATFGAFHAAAIHLVHHYFSGRTQGRGQALYSSLSFGAGVAVGSLLSGVLWSKAGAGFTFLLSAPAAGLGWLVVWSWVDKERRY